MLSSSPLSMAIGDIAAIGWNADPSDGRQLVSPVKQGLNILVDVGSASVGFKQTFWR